MPLAGQYKHYLAPAEPWERRAACIGLETNYWFPEKQGQPLDPTARKICLGCPVRNECLEFAIRTEQPWGGWGGLSERNVQRLIAQKRQADRADEVA